MEVSCDPVRSRTPARLRARGAHPPAPAQPCQPFLAHQPRHALGTPAACLRGPDRHGPEAPRRACPRASGGPSPTPMNRPHLAPQLPIAPRMARTPAPSPRLSRPLGETSCIRHIVATRWAARPAPTTSKTFRAPSRPPERTKPRLSSPALREAGDSPAAAAAAPRAQRSSGRPRGDLHRDRPDAPGCGSPAMGTRTVYLRQTTTPPFTGELPGRAASAHRLRHPAPALRHIRRMSSCHTDTSSALCTMVRGPPNRDNSTSRLLSVSEGCRVMRLRARCTPPAGLPGKRRAESAHGHVRPGGRGRGACGRRRA